MTLSRNILFIYLIKLGVRITYLAKLGFKPQQNIALFVYKIYSGIKRLITALSNNIFSFISVSGSILSLTSTSHQHACVLCMIFSKD